ncbi:MAG: alkaline phosphatase family protein [Hyphomicrobiales bacterium]|nr:alkaline phosphatase family protein [Hyphomicrobiales bacterium]MCP5371781.1 alkaline phosphatase family protein [Hyphomicrobiales bacterium]
MPAKVLVVGLDAAEPTLLEKWAAEGHLPVLARVMAAGTGGRLGNCMETLPGAIWPEIWSGRSCGNSGVFYTPDQIHTGETGLRPLEHDEMDAADNYWSLASQAGRRVCVVDQVQVPLNPGLNGIQVLEWGLHDRVFGERYHPAELGPQIEGLHGRHPVRRCDHYGHTVDDRRRLRDDLLAGAAEKEAILLDLMGREDWDLYTVTLSDSHCAGHHFWHFLDPGSPAYVADPPDGMADALRTVYQAQDRTLGALVQAAGPGCVTLVVASHGIGPAHAGYHLLPEILARLGMGSESGGGGALRRLQTAVKHAVPLAALPLLRAMLRRASDLGPIQAAQLRAGNALRPFESPRTRAMAVPNNRVGAVRLNLKGREPHGSVAPGNEEKALLEELRTEFLALEDPRSGARIVERVDTAEEVFGPNRHPDVPDLMIVFRTGMGPIDHCRSPRVGEIHWPYMRRTTYRTGDHTVESRLWAAGPGIAAGGRLDGANILDIAPTVLDLLGVPLDGPAADRLDGRPLPLRA